MMIPIGELNPDRTVTKEISWRDMEVEDKIPHEVFSGEADPLGMIHWFDITGLGAVVFRPIEVGMDSASLPHGAR